MDCWASCCAPRPTAANRQKQVDNLTANAGSSPSPPLEERAGERRPFTLLPLFLCGISVRGTFNLTSQPARENLGRKTKAPEKPGALQKLRQYRGVREP